MHNLIRLYNQNRRKFWIIIFVIALVGMFLWRFLYSIKPSTDLTARTEKQQIDSSTLNSVSLYNDYSAVNGKKTTLNQDKIDLIDSFFSFCNSGSINEAYNLISDDCKSEMYPNAKSFYDSYYKPVFGKGKRNIVVENWAGSIFSITFNEDYLSTGRYTAGESLQDYVAVVKDNEGNLKININNYIGRTVYNDTKSTDNVEIKLLRKDAYMDYEKYTFEIKNNAQHRVLLGNIQDSENVSYLVDKNGLKYQAYVHELSQSQMEILGKEVRTITIKYFSEYRSTKQLSSLVFPKIYLNYEAYNNFQDKNNYTQYGSISFVL